MDIRLVGIIVEGGGVELVIPEEFFAYRSLSSAERVASGSVRPLVRFGVFGRGVSLFFDEESGAVLSGVDPGDVALVNTSVGQFTECIQRLAAIYPFYSADSEFDAWEDAAQRVQDIVCEVDSAAYYEGSFWYEFRWDVSMGDFHE